MKNYLLALLFVAGSSFMFCSCEKKFLEIPPTANITIDTVFSTSDRAMRAVANAYSTNLGQPFPWKAFWNISNQEQMTGGVACQPQWVGYQVVTQGMTPTGITEDMDGYNSNFNYIRQAYLVKENIDRVPDMEPAMKESIKAEMQALIAFRYEQMFIMYGGVPIVPSSFSLGAVNDVPSLQIPRSNLNVLLDSIVSWCDYAASVLPSAWPDADRGRMTKAAAMAIKSKALIYAARPLFNSATPYLNFGSNNNLICFGNYDAGRWATAAAAFETLIAEAEGPGGLHVINTGHPLDDYGNATSTPANQEVILGYKNNADYWSQDGSPFQCFFPLYDPYLSWKAQNNTLSCVQLENYYKADGTDQTWPALDAVAPFSEFLEKTGEMEPRFQTDFLVWGASDAPSNPGQQNWLALNHINIITYGVGQVSKFYYHAGRRWWFEFPIFRMAWAYLCAAEAYNEMGQPAKALQKLNVVHQRAGLPAITETDQQRLRAIIQREFAAELFNESYRMHDVKHWKIPGLGSNGIIGGPLRFFRFNDGGGIKNTGNTNYGPKVVGMGFWSPSQFLNPFPQVEVNKGYLVQNPGY